MIEDLVIKCGDCSQPLVDAVVVEDDSAIKSHFKIIGCPKCGGTSFDTKVFTGKVSLCAVNPDKYSLEVLDTELVGDVVYIILEVKK